MFEILDVYRISMAHYITVK